MTIKIYEDYSNKTENMFSEDLFRISSQILPIMILGVYMNLPKKTLGVDSDE